jgi:hypothetical protein
MIVLHLPWISLTILSFVAIMDEEVAHWQLAITPKRLAVRPASAAIISTVVSITLGNTTACLRAVTSGRNFCYCPDLSPVVITQGKYNPSI